MGRKLKVTNKVDYERRSANDVMKDTVKESMKLGLSRGKRKRLIKKENWIQKNHFKEYLTQIQESIKAEKSGTKILGDVTGLRDALEEGTASTSKQETKELCLRGKKRQKLAAFEAKVARTIVQNETFRSNVFDVMKDHLEAKANVKPTTTTLKQPKRLLQLQAPKTASATQPSKKKGFQKAQ